MKKESVEYVCDVCKQNKIQHPSTNIQKLISVVFENEQTEGRPTKPYLSNHKVDICDNCLVSIYSGDQLFSSGAMGYNEYFFRRSRV